MRAILLGPPGAGKGTQAELIRDTLEVPHISTGDLLRTAVEAESELGLQAKGYMDRGELVPDALVVDLIRERLTKDAADGFLLDGFPRNVAQGETLEELLQERKIGVDHVISLSVPVEELVSRLLGRGRSDDNEEVIRERLAVFEEETSPLCEFYRTRGVLREIDGMGSPEEISRRIIDQVSPKADAGRES